MAKFNVRVNGFYNDLSDGGTAFQEEKLIVIYSDDKLGKTLSIGSERHHCQMTVPFDQIIKLINER